MTARSAFLLPLVLLANCTATALRAPVAAVASSSTPAPSAASAPPCEEPERRALDFWIGDFDLVVRARKGPGSQEWGEAHGVSQIRSVLNGCSIEENFHADGPRAPWAGRSFSTYVPSQRRWRQTWVDDSGSYLSFQGGAEGGDFVLYGEPFDAAGQHVQMRMAFRDVTRDALRWSWERGTSSAPGVTPTDWSPMMTITYARRKAPAPGTACDADPSFHDLDFWIGDWRVMAGGKQVGTNRISKIEGGCALRELWKDAGGSEGESLFFHPPSSSSWRQVWVTPQATSLGGAKEKQLIGRDADGSLRFQGELPVPSGRVLLDRTTLTPLPGGRVHQVIAISRDAGAHWETKFDATYERL